MDYRRYGDTVYLRIDKGEEVLETIRAVCKQEGVPAGYFQGIGACDRAVLSAWITDKEDFVHHTVTGVLEMLSLSGNISTDHDGEPFLHSHASFSYLDHEGRTLIAAGHLQDTRISYTGEITIEIAGGPIGRMFDPRAGIDVWDFSAAGNRLS